MTHFQRARPCAGEDLSDLLASSDRGFESGADGSDRRAPGETLKRTADGTDWTSSSQIVDSKTKMLTRTATQDSL